MPGQKVKMTTRLHHYEGWLLVLNDITNGKKYQTIRKIARGGNPSKRSMYLGQKR